MDNREYCRYIGKLATKALLYEVSATPKPGLVDRNNSGAHRDMDFYTFIDSSVVLTEYFTLCTESGILFDGNDYTELLKTLRPLGIKAESDMYKATNRVNTHKGLIFSLGFITSAAGLIYNKSKKTYILATEISDVIKLIVKNITNELEHIVEGENLSYGEKLYLKYGIKGIRGEVESGFVTVLKYSLPILKQLIKKQSKINDVLVQVLLVLMANTQDSNILGRHNMDTLNFTKKMAAEALNKGGYFTSEGRKFVEEMDKCFIQKNISPGGSADLIAVTLLLYFIENGDNLKSKNGVE